MACSRTVWGEPTIRSKAVSTNSAMRRPSADSDAGINLYGAASTPSFFTVRAVWIIESPSIWS
ncbi:MAG: hypothetical protein UZ18_ATM001000969 [Armatimonadetes bacterium OLB18]|nr:MAG: hypothetical protein UZ18_ATM001000969 [Armatimonadetes bacterium OLB18]